MRSLQLFTTLAVVTGMGLGYVGCGSSSSSNDGGGGSGGTGALGCLNPGASNGSCSASDLNAYDTCVLDKCQSPISSCFGDLKGGHYGGACGTWFSCFASCGCSASNIGCLTSCGEPPAACVACQQTVDDCQKSSGCAKPACLQTPDGGAVPNLDAGVVIPGFDGSLPGFDGGIPDVRIDLDAFGGNLDALGGILDALGSHTCADLTACCNGMPDGIQKQICVQEASAAGSNNFTCSALYAGFNCH
jgi:hypothetical protein